LDPGWKGLHVFVCQTPIKPDDLRSFSAILSLATADILVFLPLCIFQ